MKRLASVRAAAPMTPPGGRSRPVATGSSPLSYQWMFNGAKLPGATGQSLPLVNAQPDQDGTYYVVITNAAGSVTSSNAFLTVNPPATLTISPALVTNNFTGTINLAITGLSTGQTVRVDRYYLLNQNVSGPLVQSFSVTDGQVATIGGVRNWNVPGDDDSATNARLQIKLPFPTSVGAVSDGAVGNFIFQVSDPSAAFAPLTQTFTVMQNILPQGVTGQVTVAGTGTPLPGALVSLTPNNGPGGVIAPVDASGGFTLFAPAGAYNLYAFKDGYVSGGAQSSFTITANQLATNNLVVSPGAFTVSGSLADAASGAGLAGIAMSAQSTNGSASAAFTDNNGGYVLSVGSGQWSLKPDGGDLAHAGYLALENGETVNINSASVTGADLYVPRANALIYGGITSMNQTPVVGAIFYALPAVGQFGADGVSLAPSGGYSLGVLGGSWTVGADPGPLGALGFAPTAATNVTVAAGQAVQVNFVVPPHP